jgi:hypothetical protein
MEENYLKLFKNKTFKMIIAYFFTLYDDCKLIINNLNILNDLKY